MTVLALTRRHAATLAAIACSAVTASAQVATTPGYAAGGYAAGQTTPIAYTAPPANAYAQHPMYSGATSQPAYGQPAYGQPAYGQPAYAAPRVADASAAVVAPSAPPVVAPAAAGQAAHAATHGAWESYAGNHAGVGYAQPSCGTAACGAGACGTGVYGAGGCDTGVCDLGSGCGNRPSRQWFGGIYYLLLDRVYGDRQQVGFRSDTLTTDYYYQPTDVGFFSDDADLDPLHGAEIRFGSTFGPANPCTCEPRFAWELAYWALDDGDARSLFVLDDPISSGNPDRIYGTIDYSGLVYDPDGAGPDPARPLNEYTDYGVPTDFANDVRVVALRVRRRFQAQNLELNFWRFGTPECGSACGGGGCGGAACGSTCGVGGCGDSCGGGVGHLGLLRSSRAPRRFFINGLLGVRYFRFDDDLGIDTQFALVDGAGDPNPGERDVYSGSFPLDDPRNIVHDIETDNQLVGLQLGCSMNWLVGCKWNLFADSNFGIYGNNIEVYQRVVGGSGVLEYAGGGDVVSRSSETAVSFLGELRAGVAYQISCNCRLSAAYRFIGLGGVSLADSQIPDAGFSNPAVVSYVDTDDSLILHGLQLGAEYQF